MGLCKARRGPLFLRCPATLTPVLSRKRERGQYSVRRRTQAVLMRRGWRLPLPQAGEGWGEGRREPPPPQRRAARFLTTPSPAATTIGKAASDFNSFSTMLERTCVTPGSLKIVSCRHSS